MGKSLEFLARWSRLKRASVRKPERDASAPEPAVAPPGEAREEEAAPPAPMPSDRAPSEVSAEVSLPPIETIDHATQMGPFLREGVPEALQRAALRRAWVADPAIRDFVGLAENQWDFTDPSAMAGFGPLSAADDVPRLVAQALGHLDEAALSADAATEATGKERSEPPDPTTENLSPPQKSQSSDS
jgi:hypothetical protein